MYLDVRVDNLFFFFKQKTAYEMRISDWSSDVCSSDLYRPGSAARLYRRPDRRADGLDRRGSRQTRKGDAHRSDPAHARLQGSALRRDPRRCPHSRSRAGTEGSPSQTAVRKSIARDRKSGGEGTRVSVRVDLGGGRSIK